MQTNVLSVPLPLAVLPSALRAIADVLDGAVAEPSPMPAAPVGDLRQWTGADDEFDAAVELWADKLNDASRAVFGALIDADGEFVTRHELANLLNFEDPVGYGIAGVFGWPGRYAAALGYSRPFDAGEKDGVTAYRMAPNVAELFRRAREQYEGK